MQLTSETVGLMCAMSTARSMYAVILLTFVSLVLLSIELGVLRVSLCALCVVVLWGGAAHCWQGQDSSGRPALAGAPLALPASCGHPPCATAPACPSPVQVMLLLMTFTGFLVSGERGLRDGCGEWRAGERAVWDAPAPPSNWHA